MKPKVTKRNNIYVCPFCGEEYVAFGDEVLTFYEFECPNCGNDVDFDSSKKKE